MSNVKHTTEWMQLPVSGDRLIVQWNLQNDFEPLDFNELNVLEGSEVDNVQYYSNPELLQEFLQPHEVLQNLHGDKEIEPFNEMAQLMDLGGEAVGEGTVAGSYFPLVVNHLDNGGHQLPVLFSEIPEPLTRDFQNDAKIQYQAAAPVSPVTLEDARLTKNEIAKLLKESRELDTAAMPSKKSQPRSGKGYQPNQMQCKDDLSPKEKKRLAKNTYSKVYREAKKAKQRQLERENAYYKLQLGKFKYLIRRLRQYDAKLDSKIESLLAEQGVGRPEIKYREKFLTQKI